jgi:hypothetical protein
MPYKLDQLSAQDLSIPEEGATDSMMSAAAIALARALEPEAPKAELKARLVASVGRKGAYGIFADRVARLFDLPVDAAQALLEKLDEPAVWGPGFFDGMELIPVTAGKKYSGAIATFVKFRPGAHFPRHVHVGEEITLVMSGRLRDSTGIEIARGEELFEADGSEHEFFVPEGKDCIAAAIVHGYIDLK